MRQPRVLSLAASAVTSATLAALMVAVPGAPAEAAPTVRDITTATCPDTAPEGTLRDGSDGIGAFDLCRQAAAAAPTPQARKAIKAAFRMLGAPYACNGVGRASGFRFDCSSLVARAYALAGVDTAGPGWAASTQDMVPWGGARLADWAAYVAPSALRPGDLVLYDTGGATFRHVAMYIGNGYMLHTGYCGDVAHVTSFWGFGSQGRHSFLVARRVMLPGQTRPAPAAPKPTTPAPSSGTAVAAYPGRPLRPGMSGPAVASVQRSLLRMGYQIPAVQSGAVALGGYGTQTFDAVALYQREHHTGGTPGVVDSRLYQRITGWRPGSTGRSVTPTTGRTVSVSGVLTRNPRDVAIVQAGLNKVVGAGLPTNGKWGPLTQAAFDQFRRQVMRLTGANATGTPGAGSLAKLGALAGFRVTG